jgi:GDP-4-dehydro-6-deoxy-D-mannose reductase
MSKTILITGITGFAGSHLADLLLDEGGYEIHGIRRWRSSKDSIRHIINKISLHECDVTDQAATRSVIEKYKPDIIFHLAAQSFVPASWVEPTSTITTNIIGTVNILEAARHMDPFPIIHVSGSSEEYGLINEDEIPVTETNQLRPLNPYSVSKAGQTLLAMQYFHSYKMPIVCTRAFNHTGSRQSDMFVCSDFARQVAEIEKKLKEPVMKVGNLTSQRDFLDVRDVVKGYKLAAEKGTPGNIYNLSSGKPVTIQQILDILLSMAKTEITVEQDPKRMRPSDIPLIKGSSQKMTDETGWTPEHVINDSLEDLLDYWRRKI